MSSFGMCLAESDEYLVSSSVVRQGVVLPDIPHNCHVDWNRCAIFWSKSLLFVPLYIDFLLDKD